MKREYQRRPQNESGKQDNQQVLVDALAAALVNVMQNPQASQMREPAMNNNYRGSIDMMALFYHILSKIRYVIAAALLGAILVGSYGIFLVTPVYEATSKLYIMSQNDVAVSLSDLQIGALLTMDYQEVFKTWEVHEMVREELGLDYSYKDMQGMMRVYNPEDTRVLYITVTHEDAQVATDIANAYANSAKQFILQTMDAEEPNVFSIALVPSIATGMSKTRYIILGFVLGTVVSLAALFLHFVLDDRPRTPEDISKAAGIPTLSVIPKESRVAAQRKKTANRGGGKR